jgi:catechol 2,3-dioxygenase-like lactoylglutathione lyase family enzyme
MIAHGTILGGTITVPVLVDAIAAWRDVLGLELCEQGTVDAGLATSWGAPACAGRPTATLRPKSSAPFWVRLVEQPAHPEFVPTTTFGWAAYELTVQDVFGWPERLARSAFEIIGPPKTIANMEPAFIPMQVLGTGREMVYLNEVVGTMPGFDLPRAACPVDKAFIVVLAAKDRAASVRWYVEALGLEESATFTIPYTMINRAFGLPADHQTTLTMVASGTMPVVEVDDYPAAVSDRPCHAGMLPPGNAMVTLAVPDLDACKVDWIAPPAVRKGAIFEGRRAGTTLGVAGELVELVEVG